jgi:hypothetical protein
MRSLFAYSQRNVLLYAGLDLARPQEHGRVEMVHQGAGGANADAFCEGMQTLAGARTKQRLLRTVDNCSTGFDK